MPENGTCAFTDNKPDKDTKMLMRADALLSRFGYCSRREAAGWIKRGGIACDGKRIGKSAEKIDPARALIDGKPVEFPAGLFIRLHKPAGFVCTHSEEEGPSVYDLLPKQWMRRNPVPTVAGRLDKDATGLVLITDDHGLVHRLIAPRHNVPKKYRVELDRPVDENVGIQFASGTLLLKNEASPCLPASLTRLSAQTCQVTIFEGRYHQVKRMFAACGYEVRALHRLSIGEWELGALAVGTWEPAVIV